MFGLRRVEWLIRRLEELPLDWHDLDPGGRDFESYHCPVELTA